MDLARLIASRGGSATVLKNPAGRRNMAGWWRALRWAPGPRLQDLLETVARIWSVLLTELRLRRFDGVAVLDRGLECQLALREARGLRPGVVLSWLQRILPSPDVVVYFEVPVSTALARIDARGTDIESAADLAALDAGYRRLPGFPTFTVIDAGGSRQHVVDQLLPLVVSPQVVPAS
jgi:dTMP kinase